MKRNINLLLLSTLCVAITGCNKQLDEGQTAITPELETESETYVPQTREQQQAYALGSSLATRLSMGLEQTEMLGVDIDQNYVVQGFNDAVSGMGLIAPATSTELLEALQEQVARATAELSQSAG